MADYKETPPKMAIIENAPAAQEGHLPALAGGAHEKNDSAKNQFHDFQMNWTENRW
jgi:hypothetical protein